MPWKSFGEILFKKKLASYENMGKIFKITWEGVHV